MHYLYLSELWIASATPVVLNLHRGVFLRYSYSNGSEMPTFPQTVTHRFHRAVASLDQSLYVVTVDAMRLELGDVVERSGSLP